MPSPLLPLLAAAMALALGACSPQPDDPADPAARADATAMPSDIDQADPREPATPAADPCDASAVQPLVGQEATTEVVEQARLDAGAETVRTLRPGQAVTLEYLDGRLNVDVDEDNLITGLRCG